MSDCRIWNRKFFALISFAFRANSLEDHLWQACPKSTESAVRLDLGYLPLTLDCLSSSCLSHSRQQEHQTGNINNHDPAWNIFLFPAILLLLLALGAKAQAGLKESNGEVTPSSTAVETITGLLANQSDLPIIVDFWPNIEGGPSDEDADKIPEDDEKDIQMEGI